MVQLEDKLQIYFKDYWLENEPLCGFWFMLLVLLGILVKELVMVLGNEPENE